MQLQFIVILMGGIILSTKLAAAGLKDNSSPTPSNTMAQKNFSGDHQKSLEDLPNIHNQNVIFHND